jgi:hypothetical protein
MVDRTEAAVACEKCKQAIRWRRWQLFNVVLDDFPFSSLAEKREGHCDCKGKRYVQSRSPHPTVPTPIAAVKSPSRRR